MKQEAQRFHSAAIRIAYGLVHAHHAQYGAHHILNMTFNRTMLSHETAYSSDSMASA